MMNETLFKVDLWTVHVLLLGQTVFLIMWAVLPWWREWVGRALMVKSAALWLLISVNLALYWYTEVTGIYAAWMEWAAYFTHLAVTIGVWSQVAALTYEGRRAHKTRRVVTGTQGRGRPTVGEDAGRRSASTER